MDMQQLLENVHYLHCLTEYICYEAKANNIDNDDAPSSDRNYYYPADNEIAFNLLKCLQQCLTFGGMYPTSPPVHRLFVLLCTPLSILFDSDWSLFMNLIRQKKLSEFLLEFDKCRYLVKLAFGDNDCIFTSRELLQYVVEEIQRLEENVSFDVPYWWKEKGGCHGEVSTTKDVTELFQILNDRNEAEQYYANRKSMKIEEINGNHKEVIEVGKDEGDSGYGVSMEECKMAADDISEAISTNEEAPLDDSLELKCFNGKSGENDTHISAEGMMERKSEQSIKIGNSVYSINDETQQQQTGYPHHIQSSVSGEQLNSVEAIDSHWTPNCQAGRDNTSECGSVFTYNKTSDAREHSITEQAIECEKEAAYRSRLVHHSETPSSDSQPRLLYPSSDDDYSIPGKSHDSSDKKQEAIKEYNCTKIQDNEMPFITTKENINEETVQLNMDIRNTANLLDVIESHKLSLSFHWELKDKIDKEAQLQLQRKRCMCCKALFEIASLTSRFCEYTGGFYCSKCHKNTYRPLPSRIVNFSKFDGRKVCRSAALFLDECYRFPVFDVYMFPPANRCYYLLQKQYISRRKLLAIRTVVENACVCETIKHEFIQRDLLRFEPHMRKNAAFLTLKNLQELDAMDRYRCRGASDTMSIDDSVFTNFWKQLNSPSMVPDMGRRFRLKRRDFMERLTACNNQWEFHIRSCKICVQSFGTKCTICQSSNDLVYLFDAERLDRCQKCGCIRHLECTYRTARCPTCFANEGKMKCAPTNRHGTHNRV